MIYTDIKSFADDLIGTDDTKFPVARKTRFANRALERIESLILSADGKIKFDDKNNSIPPIGTWALTAGNRTQQILEDSGGNPILKIVAVSVKDKEGTYHDIEIVDVRTPDAALIRKGNGETGTPRKAVLLGNNLIFDYTPDYGFSDGIQIIYQSLMIPFVVADTTAEAGFDDQFHSLISMWMAYWEGLKRGKKQVASLRQEIQVMEGQLLEHYQGLESDPVVIEAERYDPR